MDGADDSYSGEEKCLEEFGGETLRNRLPGKNRHRWGNNIRTLNK